MGVDWTIYLNLLVHVVHHEYQEEADHQEGDDSQNVGDQRCVGGNQMD